ncbi:MAG: Stk1 family PASTA domain-containing Ser/Thr kinase [Thermoleophilia bacterium]
MIGRVFDNRYEVVRKLGAGGMAEVYLARDRHLERDVALKVLSAKYAHDAQFVERFRREASSAAGLNHPNIVQIYDRGEAEGTYYIAMEFLEGRPLKELIVRYAPLRPDHVVSIAQQILEALRFAHRRDVIHRDIKPQNIIVDDEGRVKVTDFGIARAGSASTMTETGSILGTAHYLSPEQAQGGHAEAASDLYSLGVVMYEMITGQLPFTGENPVAIAMKHVHDAPVPPRSLVPGIPENLERVILRALAKRPEDRYLTAQAFLEDLNKVRRGETVPPPPVFLPSDLQETVPLAAQETRVMGAAGATGARTQATQLRRGGPEHRREPPDFPEPPRRRSVWPWLLVLFFVLVLAGGLYALVRTMGGGEGGIAVVPRLVGLTQEAARTAVEKEGLVLEVAGEEASTAVPPGRVTRQDPEEGNKLARGKTVRVWLAAGKGQVEVPELVGKTQLEAVAALNGLDLKLTVNQQASEDRPVGEILRQDPPPGKRVDRGSTVTVWVSSGPAVVKVTVPDLVGRDEQAAINLLNSLKLIPKSVEWDSDKPQGEVVRQSLAAGSEVAEGTQVVIYVSNASITPRVKVPDLTGMTQARAAIELGKLGLKVQPVLQPEDAYPPGTVFDQDPPATTEVPAGSTVTIIVATPLPTTTSTTGLPTTSTTGGPPPSG